MKGKAFLWIIPMLWCAGLILSIYGQQVITFNPGSRIQANSNDMIVDTYASVPCVVDWNSDGAKDLLVGCFFDGNVHLFLNSGSNNAPVFTSSTMLQTGGSPISVAYG